MEKFVEKISEMVSAYLTNHSAQKQKEKGGKCIFIFYWLAKFISLLLRYFLSRLEKSLRKGGGREE